MTGVNAGGLVEKGQERGEPGGAQQEGVGPAGRGHGLHFPQGRKKQNPSLRMRGGYLRRDEKVWKMF